MKMKQGGSCACGHDHKENDSITQMGKEQERERLAADRKLLEKAKEHLAEIEKLHEKIDGVLVNVTKENIGLLLTQKKTVKDLKKLYQKAFSGSNRNPALEAMRQVEESYIRDIEDILRTAQIFKRASRGNITSEVLSNMENSLHKWNLTKENEG